MTRNISYVYNVDGSIDRVTYPSGLKVNHGYSSAGRLLSVSCSVSPCSAYGPFFAKDATYAANGALKDVVLGYVVSGFAGIKRRFTYNNRMQPLEVKARRNSDSVDLLKLTYSFVQAAGKNNGTPVSITNNITSGRTQNFTYDEMNRLKTAYSTANSGSDCWGQSFTYDRYSNLSNISVTKCSAPSLSLSIDSGTNKISNGGFGYDAAGNLTGTGSDTYTYNAEGLMATNSGTAYTYDGGGLRTKKQAGKLYWYGLNGEVLAETDASGNNISEYIYFNGRRIARREASGTVYYFITDHIGNVRVVASASGGVVEESDYLPFGTENVITSTLDNNYKFIGMERDFEGTAALDHTLYRQYAPNLARWTSPDPVHGSPANPQTWNRYPYVINDPMTKIDPLGLTHDGAHEAPSTFVGCFPDPFFVRFFDFGCGWDPENDPCPPGFEAIYGDPRPNRNGGPAIANIRSLHDYANAVLPWGPGYGELYGYELTSSGVRVNFPGPGGSIGLGSLGQIEWFGQFINQLQIPGEGPAWTPVGREACDIYADTAEGAILWKICISLPEGPTSNSIRGCLLNVYDRNEGYDTPLPIEDYGVLIGLAP